MIPKLEIQPKEHILMPDYWQESYSMSQGTVGSLWGVTQLTTGQGLFPTVK